jgi:uncharacterized membrane protein YdjX (TVP38/TMEM64 family)
MATKNKKIKTKNPEMKIVEVASTIDSKVSTKAELKKLWQSVRSLIFFVLLLILIPQIENWIGQDNIKNFITGAGIWAPISFILIRLLTVVIAPLRLGPISTLMHRAFGLWPSLLYTVIVITVGSTINYFVSRKWGNKIIGFFFGPEVLKTIDLYAQKYLDRDFKTTTLMFLSNFELMGYAAGLTGLKWWKVTLTSFSSSLITAPILVIRDLSIGNNDALASALFVLSIALRTAPILLVAKDDIVAWWKAEMKRIKEI